MLFLWRGAPSSDKGAKIAWDSVCTPIEEGSLSLRRLAVWNKVLKLKLILLLFAVGSSLWVSWGRRNLIRNFFWMLDPCRRQRRSWIWKEICKLRHTARGMI